MNFNPKTINMYELSIKLFGKPYLIKNTNLYQQAFTHKKIEETISPKNCNSHSNHILNTNVSYERLEFLGDSILNFIICDYLYNRYINNYDIKNIDNMPNLQITDKIQESFLTDLKIKLVNSDILSWLCKCLDIEKYILQVNNFKFTNSSINEDIFEALMGAILLDHNFYIVQELIIKIIENPNFIDFTDLILKDTNYKKKLFIYFQKKMDGRLPIFHTLYLPPSYSKHKYFHVVVCSPNGKVLGFGISNTLKMAQQSACKNAFEINDFNDPSICFSEYKYLYSLINVNISNDISPVNSFLSNTSSNDFVNEFELSNCIKLFNPNNIKITNNDIIQFLTNILNITPQELKPISKNDLYNYQRAFIHKSYYQICQTIIETEDNIQIKEPHILSEINVINISSNELLNFLGNSLLIYILSKYLYNLYPNEKEGVLTKIKTSEIQSKNLTNMCKLLNLNKFYVLNSNDEVYRYNQEPTNDIKTNDIKNDIKNLDEVFCSFIASIYLNQGIEFVEKFIIHLWKQNKRFENFVDENYKHKLLLLIQENVKYKKYLHPYPKYVLTNEINLEKKIFITEVYDPDGNIIGKGVGKNKRLSEQDASKNAIISLSSTTSSSIC
jgi:ribonuclease-3